MPFNLKQEILVIQTAFIGDVFLMVPMLKELRKLYPNDVLNVVVRSGLADFLKKFNLADEVFEVKKGNRDSYIKAQEHLKLRKFRYVIAPHSSLRTALFSLPLRAEKKISYRQWWNKFIYDFRLTKNENWPEPMRQLQLLEPLWQQNLLTHFNLEAHIDYRKMAAVVANDLLMSVGDQHWAPHINLRTQLLQEQNLNKFIVLFPGSVWKTKQWTIEGFTQLAQQLEGQNYNIVLMGSEGEKQICNIIAAGLKRKINLAGCYSLWESLLLLSAAKLVVCNDSGSMHMAAFANVPTVAVFGPTVLSQGFRPWQNRAVVVENVKLECRPCGKHGHKVCPLGHHECMKSISSALVFSACKSYI